MRAILVDHTKDKKVKNWLLVLIGVLCIGVGLVFGALNDQAVTLSVYFFSIELGLGAAVMLGMLLGALLTALVMLLTLVWPQSHAKKKIQKKHDHLLASTVSDAGEI